MKSVKKTLFYKEALHEINFSFGTYFLYDHFVIGEVKEDIIFNWDDHGKKLVENIADLYDHDGRDLVFISNRIYNYSVVPSDWIKFFKQRYRLKGYAIVSYSKTGFLNALLEKFFISTKFKRFDSLAKAVEWAREITGHKTAVS